MASTAGEKTLAPVDSQLRMAFLTWGAARQGVLSCSVVLDGLPLGFLLNFRSEHSYEQEGNSLSSWSGHA